MTLSVGLRDGADPLHEPIRFARLLELASNVLSGRGELGILAEIGDSADRLRFASALWLEGADSASCDFWWNNLHRLLADHGIDPSGLELDEDALCACGHPLSRHGEKGGFGSEGSRAWHLYMTNQQLNATVLRARTAAAFEHRILLEWVLQIAHDAQALASRRAEAWQVIDDIDHRRPVIKALARLFRVAPAAIRVMRQWRPSSAQHWLSYSSARRFSSMLALIPAHCRGDLDARELWQWLSVAHSIMRSTSVSPDYLMRAEFLDAIERLVAIKPAKRIDRRRMLRHAIRWLRLRRRRQGGHPRPSRLLAAIGLPVPQPTELSFRFDLLNGWRAASLDTPDAIRQEGAVMQHCLARYVKAVMRGGVPCVRVAIERWKPTGDIIARTLDRRWRALCDACRPRESGRVHRCDRRHGNIASHRVAYDHENKTLLKSCLTSRCHWKEDCLKIVTASRRFSASSSGRM